MIRTPKLRAVLLAVLTATSVAAGVVAFGGTAFGQDGGTGDVLVVDGSGEEGNYTSISGALADASPGDTVEVHDGTYEERVVLDTRNVTLEAATDAGATITYAPDSATGQPTIAVTANGSTVSGFVVERVAADDRGTGTGPAFAQGVRVSASDATVTDNEVVGEGFDDLNNKGVMVIDDESGDASGETVESVTVTGNDVSGFAGPLSLAAYYGGSVGDVDFSGNSLSGYLSDGISVGEQDGTVNVSLGDYDYEATSDDYPGTTVYFDGESDALDFGANASGVVVEGPDGDYVVGPGMSVQDAVNASADGDTVHVRPGTYDEGVRVGTGNVSVVGSGGPDAAEANRSVVDSADGPVVRVNAPNVTVSGLVVTGADGTHEAGQGVDVNGDEYDTDGVRLADLVVEGNDDRGLVVDYTDNATIENVVVRDNFDPENDGDTPEDGWETAGDADGITLWYANGSTVVDVRAVNNSDNGVYANGNDNRFVNVTARNNGDEGLDVSSERVTGGAEVVGLTAVDNNAEALEIEGNDEGANVTLEDVTLADSPRGLFVRGNNAGSVTVANATLENNAVQVLDNASSVDVASVFEAATFDRAAVVQGGHAIYGTVQGAVDAALDGDTVELAAGTYDGRVTLDEDVTLTGAGQGATTLYANSSDVASNHEPTLSVYADATVENLSVVREVTGPPESDGHTKALGVSREADGDSTDATVRNVAVTLADETGEDGYGNALWVNSFNANGGDRYRVNATLVNVTATNDGAGVDRSNGIGGAAIAAVSVEEDVSLVVRDSTVYGSERGLHTVEQSSNVSVALRDSDFRDNAVHVNDTAGGLDVDAALSSNTFDGAVTVRDADFDVAVPAVFGAIQDGVDAAESGEVVHVDPGTYDGSVTVTEDDVHLLGSGDETVLTGQVDFGDSYADGVRISEFNFTGAVDGAIQANGAGDDLLVQRSTFDGPAAAVVTGGTSTGQAKLQDGWRIAHNRINGTGVTHDRAALQLRQVTNVSVYNNTITNATFSGVSLWQTPTATVDGNRIVDTRRAGVYVADPLAHEAATETDVLVHENTFVDAGSPESEYTQAAVLVDGSVANRSGVRVYSNRIAEHRTHGVYVLDDEGVNATGEVDATHNYWGAPGGPGARGPGDGANVSANVAYRPWYVTPGLTELSSDPPRLTDVTLTDATDGDGVVGGGDEVRVGATATDGNGVRTVTADASAFGAGTVTLTDDDGDGRYVATFVVDATAAAADGEHALSVRAVDGRDNAASTRAAEGLRLATGGPGGGFDGAPPSTGGGADGDATDAADAGDGVSATIEGGNATVDLDGDGNVSTMTVSFGDDASGEVTVESVGGTPDDVAPVPDATPVAVVDVTVPDALTDEAATLRVGVSADAVGDADPSELVVHHHADDGWEALDTSVVSTTGDEVVLEADTPGFSLFAVGVSETRETTTPTPTTDGPEGTTTGGPTTGAPTTTDEPVDATAAPRTTTDGADTTTPVAEPGGFGSLATAVVVALVGLVVALFYVRYRRD